jgi:hypothetical protein
MGVEGERNGRLRGYGVGVLKTAKRLNPYQRQLAYTGE